MYTETTVMWDRPSSRAVAGGFSYNILTFWLLPFVCLLMMQGSFDNVSTASGVEMGFHAVNFLAAVYIFWRYLRDSFINVQINLKAFFSVVWKSILLVMAAAVFLYYVAMCFLDEHAPLGAFGALPLFEMDLFVLSGVMVGTHPVLGTVCAVLLGPVTVSCLYYATIFAPMANRHPVLGYLVTAVCIAVPRISNALTYWIPEEELVLYLVQLPVHMLACRAYQKADTVWAPIAVLMAVNAIASVVLHVLWALG